MRSMSLLCALATALLGCELIADFKTDESPCGDGGIDGDTYEDADADTSENGDADGDTDEDIDLDADFETATDADAETDSDIEVPVLTIGAPLNVDTVLDVEFFSVAVESIGPGRFVVLWSDRNPGPDFDIRAALVEVVDGVAEISLTPRLVVGDEDHDAFPTMACHPGGLCYLLWRQGINIIDWNWIVLGLLFDSNDNLARLTPSSLQFSEDGGPPEAPAVDVVDSDYLVTWTHYTGADSQLDVNIGLVNDRGERISMSEDPGVAVDPSYRERLPDLSCSSTQPFCLVAWDQYGAPPSERLAASAVEIVAGNFIASPHVTWEGFGPSTISNVMIDGLDVLVTTSSDDAGALSLQGRWLQHNPGLAPSLADSISIGSSPGMVSAHSLARLDNASLAVWNVQNGDNLEIHGRPMTAEDGVPAGDEFTITAGEQDTLFRDSLAADENGFGLLVYLHTDSDSGDMNVMALPINTE